MVTTTLATSASSVWTRKAKSSTSLLGGNAARDASLGKILGPSFAQDEMADVIEKLIDVYVEQRTEDERFIDTYQRIGIDPFKERVYAANH